MKKRRIIAVVLCLMVFAFMSLGSGSSDSKKKDIVSEGKEKTEDSKGGSGKSSKKTVPTIEEQVLLDKSGVKITATEYVNDSIWGEGIKLVIDNSTDKDLMVGCTALIVNDYMISDLFAAEVAAGKSANETMYLSSAELEAAGIESVGKVEIYFHVYDNDSFDDILNNEYAEIQTSEYASMDTTPNDGGTELYNAGGIRIVGKTVDEDSFWGASVLLYMENSSGRNVHISVEDMSVNGIMVDPIFYAEIYDGKKAIDDITLFSSDLEENGIEAIENVELKFKIYDVDTYDDIDETDVISFTAE
ncbi:MAG: hypothetical protein K5848_04055 [Lachnospiraceae bacterium]|nr:hypothetical protein [Lachnospiraceae bacterium]